MKEKKEGGKIEKKGRRTREGRYIGREKVYERMYPS